MISASLQTDEVSMSLLSLMNVDQKVSPALHDVAEEIMRLSQMEVPHHTGTLQNSGTVENIGGAVVVGYHTPYAARLHEHPEYRFQKGRKGKYLEDPIRRNADALGIRFGKNIKISLEGSIK